jgi:hypothetical protein
MIKSYYIKGISVFSFSTPSRSLVRSNAYLLNIGILCYFAVKGSLKLIQFTTDYFYMKFKPDSVGEGGECKPQYEEGSIESTVFDSAWYELTMSINTGRIINVCSIALNISLQRYALQKSFSEIGFIPFITLTLSATASGVTYCWEKTREASYEIIQSFTAKYQTDPGSVSEADKEAAINAIQALNHSTWWYVVPEAAASGVNTVLSIYNAIPMAHSITVQQGGGVPAGEKFIPSAYPPKLYIPHSPSGGFSTQLTSPLASIASTPYSSVASAPAPVTQIGLHLPAGLLNIIRQGAFYLKLEAKHQCQLNFTSNVFASKQEEGVCLVGECYNVDQTLNGNREEL